MMLLEELKNKQRNLGFTDEQFSQKLQVHRITWVNIKNGKRPMSADFKIKAIRAFPELQGVFLAEEATQSSISITPETD